MTEQIEPELAKRMETLLRKIAAGAPVRPAAMVDLGAQAGNYTLRMRHQQECFNEAVAIVAELPAPVDPDLLLAREVLNGRYVRIVGAGGFLRSVDRDDLVELALAAIKRVRSEQGAKA